jgi:hypothetical protein
MSPRGFRFSLLNQLIRAGLATSYIHREDRGAKIIESVRVKITEAGRKHSKTFTLRRFVWPTAQRSSRPDDFNILHDSDVVGRQYRMNGVGREQWRWTHFWYTRGLMVALPTPSMTPKQAAFRAAWGARVSSV